MTLGIAIPLIDRHIKHLNRLLDTIQMSTIKPNTVSISSPSNLDDIIGNKYSFDIIVTNNGRNLPTTVNRNIAANKLNTDIISFIDADDASHVFRNEFLINSFKNTNIIVHNYHKSLIYDESFIHSDIGEMNVMYDYIDTMESVGFPYSSKGHLDYSCGHVTVSKNIFNNYKFNENFLSVGEDINYLRLLMENNFKITYISNKLTNYIK